MPDHPTTSTRTRPAGWTRPPEPRTTTVYREHKCTRRHRSSLAAARCVWRRRVCWIDGSGWWAAVAYCGRCTSVSLWPTRDEASSAVEFIDSLGCGGECTHNHRLVLLDLNPEPRLFGIERGRKGSMSVE